MDGVKRTLCLVKLFKHKYYMSHLQSKNNANKHIQQKRNRFTETKNKLVITRMEMEGGVN